MTWGPLRAALVLAVVLVLVAGLGSAYAFDSVGAGRISSSDCGWCHAGEDSIEGLGMDYSYGPHGDYSATSDDCKSCHTLHDATGTKRLLSADTVTAACSECHDGTGGYGVYGVLAARGLTVVGAHSIDETRVIPGGDWSTGGARTETFTGEAYRLSCDDCHSPHRSSTVATFSGDRRRDMQTYNPSDHLLKRRPTGASQETTYYGSDWCGGCHKGRFSGGAVHNHPVDSHMTTTAPFIYQNVAVVKSAASLETTMGRMARTNFGYVMPYPRTAQQAGHAPICQQCHEDARNVGAPGAATTYKVSGSYSTSPTTLNDNPRFQTFPHETTATALLIEQNDDLCVNCHPAASLP